MRWPIRSSAVLQDMRMQTTIVLDRDGLISSLLADA